MTSGGYLADQPWRVADVMLRKTRFETMSDNTLTRERSIRQKTEAGCAQNHRATSRRELRWFRPCLRNGAMLQVFGSALAGSMVWVLWSAPRLRLPAMPSRDCLPRLFSRRPDR